MYFVVSPCILFGMRNVSDKSCSENQNILFENFFPENRAFYEIMWKNMVEPDKTRAAICNTARVHCMLDNQSYKHSGYVILIAFPRQQKLRECASASIYVHIACIVLFSKKCLIRMLASGI